jgi:diguanylate cyclase (GGDEF)-like protein
MPPPVPITGMPPESSDQPSSRPSAPPPQPRPRLLAIDDDTDVHRLLKASLRHERVDVHGASKGEQGLLVARALMPEVILLDMELPDADGFSLLERLKADSATQDIPVIFLSHAPDANMIIRALDAGAIDFVAKPFDAGELRARVRNAVRMRSLIKMLAQRAQIDGLTGLWNRAHFDQRLHEEIVSAVRHGSPLALALCDLDHFKSVNDRFGHTHGDRVLEECARVLGGGRAGDISCRYGGEEFAIILPRSGAADAASLSERLRETIRELRWEEAPALAVTATFGVAELETRADAAPTAMARSLIQRADAALYAAKQSGRDRVMIAGEDDRLRASA